jgi:hypothetical protein
MASFSSVSKETMDLITFVLGLTALCTLLFPPIYMITSDYSSYRQSKLDMKKFSLKTICRIDQIISRPQENNSSSCINIYSWFLISFEINSNGNTTRQYFDEWSVPVPPKSNVVSIRV